MRIARISVCVVSLFILFTCLFQPHLPWSTLGVVCYFSLSIYRPKFALGVFLCLLPVFGNKPGSTPLHYLILFSAALVLGTLFSIREELQSRTRDNPLEWVTVLYLLVSLISLLTLPFADWGKELWWTLPDLKPSTLAMHFLLFLRSNETTVSYSILSVFHTASAAVIGYLIVVRCRQNPNECLWYGWSLLFGLVVTLLIGFLDYGQVLDLRSFRPLDPIANPRNVQFRMQSFFGHSGWFAEYVTLSVPFAILLLGSTAKRAVGVWLTLLVMIAGEIALILTYQRGGWISYPLTLIVIWGAIYAFRVQDNPDRTDYSWPRLWLKIGASVPLTILCSFLLLTFLMTGEITGPKASEFISHYRARFSDITRATDRTEFVRAGVKIGLLHPIFGAGSESFFREYRREFMSSTGRYHGEIKLPLHGSAHNVYVQTFAGKGIIGLGLLLVLIIYPAFFCFRRAIVDRQLPQQIRLLLLACGCFFCSFFIYGNVQEVFYVQSLQYLFFAVLGLSAPFVDKIAQSSSRRRGGILVGLLMLVAIHLMLESRQESRLERKVQDVGCYRPEQKKSVRWCGPRAQVSFAVEESGEKKVVHFAVRTHMVLSSAGAPTIQVYAGDTLLDQKTLAPRSTYGFDLELPQEMYSLIADKKIRLNIFSNSYFIPARDYQQSDDLRILSYQLITKKIRPKKKTEQ